MNSLLLYRDLYFVCFKNVATGEEVMQNCFGIRQQFTDDGSLCTAISNNQ